MLRPASILGPQVVVLFVMLNWLREVEVSEGMDDLCEVNMGDKNEETSSQGKKKKKHDHIIDKLVAGMEKSADSLCTAINNVANTMGNPIHKRIVDDVNRELLNIHGGHHRR